MSKISDLLVNRYFFEDIRRNGAESAFWNEFSSAWPPSSTREAIDTLADSGVPSTIVDALTREGIDCDPVFAESGRVADFGFHGHISFRMPVDWEDTPWADALTRFVSAIEDGMLADLLHFDESRLAEFCAAEYASSYDFVPAGYVFGPYSDPTAYLCLQCEAQTTEEKPALMLLTLAGHEKCGKCGRLLTATAARDDNAS